LAERAVLLVNLGTPQSASAPHVRRYLREFLMDGRVLDIPYPLRWLLVNGIIAPFRASASAHAYRSIWMPDGSPLLVHSRRLQHALAQRVRIPVELAMRYGEPSISAALTRLRTAGINRVRVFPLFPHYAMSSYESAVEAVRKHASNLAIDVVPPFYSRPGCMRALLATARPHLQEGDHVVFSFHGLPERHLRKRDPTGCTCLCSTDCCDGVKPAHATCYRSQCLQTVREFANAAGLTAGSWSFAFQSRLGRDAWLQLAINRHLVALAQAGIRRVVVLCPSFVADCLETLEEIGIRGRKTFLTSGGERFQLVPCLNADPTWIEEAAAFCTTEARNLLNSPRATPQRAPEWNR
jgi:ferrochelatase